MKQRRPQDGVETLLTYRPARHSVNCLRVSLEALAEATALPHLVSVVVQGGWRRKRCKGLLELPHTSEFPFRLKYTMNETDFGDGPVMARSFAECKRRYWAYLPGDVVLPPGAWDTLFRCMRNEDRRKEHRIVGATVSCIDDIEEPRCLEIIKKEIVLKKGSVVTREECFAVWHVVNYFDLGPLVLLRSVAKKATCCFDERFSKGGHLLDLCMQAHAADLLFIQVDQPATQLNLGCIDIDNVYAPLPDAARKRFVEKWEGCGRKLSYAG